MKNRNETFQAHPVDRDHPRLDAPYLTLDEAARLAGVSKKRMQNLMFDGVLKENIHFCRPRGLRVRFRRDALVAWLEGKDEQLISAALDRSKRLRRSNLNPDLLDEE